MHTARGPYQEVREFGVNAAGGKEDRLTGGQKEFPALKGLWPGWGPRVAHRVTGHVRILPSTAWAPHGPEMNSNSANRTRSASVLNYLLPITSGPGPCRV